MFLETVVIPVVQEPIVIDHEILAKKKCCKKYKKSGKKACKSCPRRSMCALSSLPLLAQSIEA